MPRPLRIEYEDACYHVMNRGRARAEIYHDEKYYRLFLNTLAEAHKRFAIQIQCYCLMSNHYHLMIKTPEGNLGRAMRHINGVYTQRHNRMKKTDGSLFKGRYKAILIEQDSYQLQLSRYIHLNPVDAGMVKKAEQYQWSSYRSYLVETATPEWLYPLEALSQLNVKTKINKKYQAFVEQGNDEELARFYGKENVMPFLGSESFRDWAYKQRNVEQQDLSKKMIRQFKPSIEKIINEVCEQFKVSASSIKKSQRGKVTRNTPRWIAMYLAQEKCDAKLAEIAKAFSLKSVGSIPATIQKLKHLLDEDKVLKIQVIKMISE